MAQGIQTLTEGSEEPPRFMRGITEQELGSLTSAQKGFIVSIRSLDTELAGVQLKETVAELFPPVSLFAKEICDLPSVWVELRNFLNARGASLQQHSSRRVIMTLGHGIYDDTDDRDAAVQMAQLIIAQRRKVRADLQEKTSHATTSTVSHPGPSASADGERSKLAHNIAMRLKDYDKKFSGELGECWMDYVDEYSQIARDYGLNPSRSSSIFTNCWQKTPSGTTSPR